jgi:hypothetical protein
MPTTQTKERLDVIFLLNQRDQMHEWRVNFSKDPRTRKDWERLISFSPSADDLEILGGFQLPEDTRETLESLADIQTKDGVLEVVLAEILPDFLAGAQIIGFNRGCEGMIY